MWVFAGGAHNTRSRYSERLVIELAACYCSGTGFVRNARSLPTFCRRFSFQFRKCKTDMHQGLEWDNPDRPECTNLLTIYQVSYLHNPGVIDSDVLHCRLRTGGCWMTFIGLFLRWVLSHKGVCRAQQLSTERSCHRDLLR